MRAARRPVDSQGSVTVRELSVMHGESFSITRHRSITTTTSAATASTAASAAVAAGADGDDWFPRPLYHWKTGRMHDKQPADYALSQRVQLDSSTGIYPYTLLLASIEGGGSSIAERRVQELIPVLGSQPAGDVSHKPTAGCHYFPPGLQLPTQPLRGLLAILQLVNRGTMGVKTVTLQRRGCDLNPCLLRLSPAL